MISTKSKSFTAFTLRPLWARVAVLFLCVVSASLMAQPTVVDLRMGAAGSSPVRAVSFLGEAFFVANDGMVGTELWRSDGTPGGTTLVADINPGGAGANPNQLTVAGGLLYFVANDGVRGNELWCTDGTLAGTRILGDINPNGSSEPADLIAYNGELYFSADEGTRAAAPYGTGRELWKSDGFSVTLVKNIYPDPLAALGFISSGMPSDFAVYGGLLHFAATDDVAGRELWVTDGTGAGTVRLADVAPGTIMNPFPQPASSNPRELTSDGATLWFVADDGTNGEELFRYDGGGSPPQRHFDAMPGAASGSPTSLTVSGGQLFFVAEDPSGRDLFALVGGLPTRLTSFAANGQAGLVQEVSPVSGGVCFSAIGAFGREPWFSGGTLATTRDLGDLNPFGHATPLEFTPVVGACGLGAVFSASNGTGRELWLTDGTAAGTRVFAGFGTDPRGFVAVGSTLFYAATDSALGREVHLLGIDAVLDLTAPVPNVASLPTLSGQCAVTLTPPTATDACTGLVTATTTSPLTLDTQGTHTVTWTYDDGNGNQSTQTQTVQITDTEAPVPDVASLPTLTGACGVTVSTTPTATDACLGAINGTTGDPLSYAAQGAYVITWTYDDGRGNLATQTQTVLVNDTTPPVPDVASLPALQFECSGTVSTVPTATDACVGLVSATTTSPLTFSGVGMHTIVWTYDDGEGNTSSQTQTVTITDGAAPVPDLPSLAPVVGECSVTLSTAPTATDACVGAVVGTTTDPLTYSVVGTHTVTWTFDDGQGNQSTQTQMVQVTDSAAPVPDVASLPEVRGACAVTLSVVPTATDACVGSVVGTTSDPLTYSAVGSYLVTWTYDDGQGNSVTQTQSVVVEDLLPPVPDVVSLPEIRGECAVTVSAAPTATDACVGTVTGTTTDPLSYAVLGAYLITWTYDDGHGNTITQTQTVVVEDTQPPVPDLAVLPTVSGSCTVTVATVPTATDACAGAIVGTTGDPLTYATPGAHVITWTYDDGEGNLSQQMQTVMVVGGVPTISGDPVGQTVCDGDPAIFTVAATGDPMPTLQWRKDGMPLTGETAATLNLSNTVLADGGVYDCVATNTCGSVTSAGALLVVEEQPTISADPMSMVACEGTQATLQVTASGTGIGYQWFKDAMSIPGANAASLVLPVVTPADAGSYTVMVSGTCGSVTSAAAVLTVQAGFADDPCAPGLLPGAGLYLGSTLCATPQIELLPRGCSRPGFENHVTPDQWWVLRPVCDAVLTLSTCPSESAGFADFDTHLSVFTGPSPLALPCPFGSAPVFGMAELACNDDGIAGTGGSTIVLPVLRDQYYYVRVAGAQMGEVGSYGLDVQLAPATTLELQLTQPNGPSSYGIRVVGGNPGHGFFYALSTFPQNGTSPGTGLWYGLHIDVPSLAIQFDIGQQFAQIYTNPGEGFFLGTLDAAGESYFSFGGAFPAPGLTVFGNVITWDPANGQISDVSCVVESPPLF